MPDIQTDEEIAAKVSGWLSIHLYYHEDFARPVVGFVRPAVSALARGGVLRGFHYLRFSLGGPHHRVRFDVPPEAHSTATAELTAQAEGFLGREPSRQSIPEEHIKRRNAGIIAADLNETDGASYPDNSFRMAPFHPEVERYGGAHFFEQSLDLFTLSSVAAIGFLGEYGDVDRSTLLTHALELQLRQAVGYGSTFAEVSRVVQYGVDYWGHMMPTIMTKADEVYDRQKGLFTKILDSCFEEVDTSLGRKGELVNAFEYLSQGASILSVLLEREGEAARVRVGQSQLHMTGSRLGLSNVEEVYLSRLMGNLLQEVDVSTGPNFGKLSTGAAPSKFTRDAEGLSLLGRAGIALLGTL